MLEQLRANVAGVLLGKPDVIQMALVALLADGHLLIEDVPGIGKTLLAKPLARSLDCMFHRIQFTPDLLPSDLIGTTVFHQPTAEFVFKPGPLVAHVVLADEINRATPRTQTALLEAMSDRQVSMDGRTWPLGPPFLVLATQNPYEFEGTYPLPDSQLDRFLLRCRIGYPDRAAEKQILTRHRSGEPVERLQAVLKAADLVGLQHVRLHRGRLRRFLLPVGQAYVPIRRQAPASHGAIGIPRPARLSQRRQPALAPLAHVRPLRRADGVGVRRRTDGQPGFGR